MQRDSALRTLVADRLAAWQLHAPDAAGLKQAAVVLVVADEGRGAQLRGLRQSRVWSTQAALILTRRAKGLSGHAGQWALPGGRIESADHAIPAKNKNTSTGNQRRGQNQCLDVGAPQFFALL